MELRDTSGTTPWIEIGTVTNVDPEKFVVDWQSDSNDRVFFGLQVATPNFSHAFGEGMTVMPKVGSKAVVCFPSTGHDPFVLGFVTPPDDDSADDDKENLSYGGGRDRLAEREIAGFHGRHGNQVSLLDDGTVIISSGPGAERVWLPLGKVADLALTSEGHRTGGSWWWRSEADGSRVEFMAVFKRSADDRKASAMIRIGGIEGGNVVSVAVAPGGVDPQSGRVVGNLWGLEITKQGQTDLTIAGAVSVTVNNQLSVTSQNRTETVMGSWQMVVSGQVTATFQQYTLNLAAGMSVNSAAPVSIMAPMVVLGAPTSPAVNGLALIQWLAAHKHPVPGTPPSPDDIQNLANILSKQVVLT